MLRKRKKPGRSNVKAVKVGIITYIAGSLDSSYKYTT